MTNKKLPTINIKGKEYVTVVERIKYFNEQYPEGSITTELLSKPEDSTVVVKAIVKVGEQTFTGHSQAVIGEGYINKTSALENAETSAVGRALGMMGIGIVDSFASADEMKKAGVFPTPTGPTPKPLTVEQWENSSPEEQQTRQEYKKRDNRRSYHERNEASKQSSELEAGEE